MTDIHVTEGKIKEIIDSLKGLCSQNGLGNTANEEVVVTSVFLYKFLNDKFMFNLGKFAEEIGMTVEEILKNENDELDAFYDANSTDVSFGYEDTIQYLINHVEQQDFGKQFDDALVRISKSVRNDSFAVETAGGEHKDLFEPLTIMVEPSRRNNFAKAIGYARKHRGGYDTSKWEAFLRKACDSASSRILSDGWDPVSTAEAFYIAPLAVSSGLFRNKEYAKAARKAAELFAERHLEMDGCYWGGTLDATCEDKEGAWAAFQGFLECYERFSDRRYLEWARHAMDVCLSYTVVWDIPLPPGRLSDHAFKSTGWTVVSAQNQHVDVYGVLFAPEVYKMGKILGDERLVRLSKVMFRSCSQLIDPSGSQGEQVQHTNFAQQGDMSSVYKLRGGYSENWTVFWITAHFLNAAARFRELGVRE